VAPFWSRIRPVMPWGLYVSENCINCDLLLEELKGLGERIDAVKLTADKAANQAASQKNMLTDHERTLYGHEDTRRRVSEPGVVQVVAELASAFKDVRAVAKAGWAMLGLVGFSTIVSLFSLFVRYQS
jgi:hypothetical protein